MAEAKLTPAKIKALIIDPKKRIELHDAVHKETEQLYKLLSSIDTQDSNQATEAVKAWMEKVEQESHRLRQLFIYGCYFGTDDQAYIWTRSLNRLGSLVHGNGPRNLIDLQLYPAMLALYTGGISAIAAGNGASLKALFSTKYQQPYHEPGLLARKTHGWLLDTNFANQVLELERRKTPLSDHVYELLATDYPETLIVKDDFARHYDRWEVILGMVVAHHLESKESGRWAPVGRFAWRSVGNGRDGLGVVFDEIELQQSDWPPLIVGLFNGSVKDAKGAHAYVKDVASKVNFF